MPKPRILIICTGNSARSQMAEVLMTQAIVDEFDIVSAGLDPKGLNPYAVEVMKEIGIDISQEQSKDIKGFLGQYFSYLITVCSNAEERCPIFPGVTFRLYWPFDDPAAVEGTEAEKLAKFREVRDQLDLKICDWATEFRTKPIY